MNSNTSIIVFVVFAFCFILEKVFKGWSLPKVKTWPFRVVLVNLIQLCVLVVAGEYWEHWFKISLFSIAHWPAFLQASLSYFVATFIFYWWHRWRHEKDFLWLGFHQIHHSPQRIEVITSFYKHPIEMMVNSIIGAILTYLILGMSIEGAAFYTMFTALGEFFYHTNIKTPQWVGYIFQRPEMHRIHHQYQRHKNNYGDIVWWDMLFGTYENPKEIKLSCGFDAEKEERLSDMLAFEDVHKI